MKNLLLIIAFVAGGISLTYAQEFSLGPTIGINNAWIADAPGETRSLTGLNAGLTMVYSTNEHWGIGLDLKYSGEGVITKQGGTDNKTQLNYVRIPLKVIRFFNHFEDDFRPKVYLGPTTGFLVGGKTERAGELGTIKVDSKDLFESYDIGLTVGAGFNYRLAPRTWLNFDVMYCHGLADISKTSTMYNRNVGLNLGIAWGLE